MRSTSANELGFGSRQPLLREGEILDGRYRVEHCLGSGGMASVYRAVHTGLDQPVAIKVVSGLLREVPGVVPRFMREARSATRLKGEHVVRVFDVGKSENGSPYMAMELLEGKDLAELFDAGFKPSVDEAIDYALQACEALAEVHGLGIVHRDLKPANLFITHGPDGRTCLKLIDFGISRVDAPLSAIDAIALTNPDVVMGSPKYMPPEQMESAAAADSRSDIWGLGAILYEMLLGRAPFDGESLFDIYAAAVREPPTTPSKIRADIPDGMDEVMLRCLRVDPADRYADVAALAAALAPFGNAHAAQRADAIARVLDTSRLRGHGEPQEVSKPRLDTSPSSRIHKKPGSRATRRRLVLQLGTAVLALAGLTAAGRPLARRVSFVPTVGVSDAAAATASEVSHETAATTATLTSVTLDAGVASALDSGRPPPRTPAPPATTAATTTEPTVAKPAPRPTVAPAPRSPPTFDTPAATPDAVSAEAPVREPAPIDVRTLFEDRK